MPGWACIIHNWKNLFTYHEKGQSLWPFEGDTKQRHYVLYELIATRFIGQHKKFISSLLYSFTGFESRFTAQRTEP